MNKSGILAKLKAIKSIDSFNWVQKNKELTIALILVFFIFVDISNLDSFFHKTLCSASTILPTSVVCPDFYDIPIWSVLEVSGVIATVIVALWSVNIGLKQANKQEKNAQEIKMDQDMPLILINEGPRLHANGSIQFTLVNVGKGVAKDIYVFIENVEIEGNFSMLNSSEAQKDISTNLYPDRLRKIESLIQNDKDGILEMKILYKDMYDREFTTEGIQFKSEANGNYIHNRGLWNFRKVDK